MSKFNVKNRAIWIIVAILIVLLIGSLIKNAYARELYNDPVTATADAVDNVAVHFELASETTATSTILVDRSDTTNFPHSLVGINGLEIAQIHIDWETNVSATTTGKLGVIASSSPDGANVDVYWFETFSFSTVNDLNSFNGRQSKTISYSPSTVKLDLSNGTPASFITNDSLLWTTSYATTTKLISPNGYISPGVGDLVMDIYDQKGTATTTSTIIYRSR